MDQNTVGNTLEHTFVYRPVCPHPIYFGISKNHQQIGSYQSSYFNYHININGFISAFERYRDGIGCSYEEEINKGDEVSNTYNFIKIEACQNTYGRDEDDQLISSVKNSQEGREEEFMKKGLRIKGEPTANDTKNIPKNFGKAIITFIQKNQITVVRCLNRYNVEIEKFIRQLKIRKKSLHSIKQLRSLWIDEDFIYAKPFRELSYYFLRKATFKYIFGSRVADFGSHLKYRFRIMSALHDPQAFNSIKI